MALTLSPISVYECHAVFGIPPEPWMSPKYSLPGRPIPPAAQTARPGRLVGFMVAFRRMFHVCSVHSDATNTSYLCRVVSMIMHAALRVWIGLDLRLSGIKQECGRLE